MKKIVLFVLLIVTGSIIAQTCNSHVITYSGPHNSNQLENVLNQSTSPVLQSLDVATKASIVTNLEFRQGMPIGFTALDENLKKLVATPEYLSAVFGAILGNEVIVTTFDKKPVVVEITMGEFQQMYHNDPSGNAPRTVTNWCSNCNAPDSNVYKCCEVATEPRGCLDFFVVLNGQNYKIK